MYALYKSVTSFVTALAISVALTFGCGGAVSGGDFGTELFQGLEQELSQTVYDAVAGDAMNHSPYVVAFGIFEPTKGPSDPVFMAVLEPSERVYFSLEPGKYLMAVTVTDEGEVLKEFFQPFEIVVGGGDFGFDFRYKHGLSA